MADNYLERRMEEHRASQHVARNISRPARLSAGRVIVDYPSQLIVVNHADAAGAEEIIRKFVEMKCRVTIVTENQSCGPTLAQRTGARFIPGTFNDALRWIDAHSEQVDVIIDPVAGTLSLVNEEPGKSIDIDSRAISSGSVATAAWCVFASHPANRWLFQ